MDVLALIPARGGSKRVKDKNIRYLQDKPLIVHTIEQAKAAKLVTRVIVSTDSLKIKEVAQAFDCEVIDRPAEFATDTATTLSVLQHALRHLQEKEKYNPTYLVLLQPTSPLRTAEDIDKAINLMKNNNVDCVTSVVEAQEKPYWMFKIENGILKRLLDNSGTRTQDLPKSYLLNGAIYVLKPTNILQGKTTLGVLGEKNMPYLMPYKSSVDIDTEEDFAKVEEILKHGA